MTTTNRFTKPRIIVFSILAAIIVTIDVCWGCMTYTSPLINRTFILEFIVSPILLLILIALVVFLNLKLSRKIICGVLILIAVGCISFFWMFFGAHENFAHFENDEISVPYDKANNNEIMPSLSQLGDTQSTDYYLYSLQMMVFVDESQILVCKYDENEYQMQKELLEENYVFQSEPLTALEHTCDPEVTIDGYRFRMVKTDTNNSFIFPKRMLFIATNDSTNEIVYIAYENLDLDYIDSLADLINLNCGWKHIK